MDTPEILECGHPPTPDSGCGTGYSIEHGVEVDIRRCYECSDEYQREYIKTADVFTGYISATNPNVITTWTGGVLGKVVSYGTGSRQYTPSGGWWVPCTVRVQTPDGTLWWGKGDDEWDVITVRRLKNQKQGG